MHSNIGTDLDMHMHIWQVIPGGVNVHSCYGHVVNKSSMFCSRIGNRNKVSQCVARDHPLECINSRCRSILSSMQYIFCFLWSELHVFPPGTAVDHDHCSQCSRLDHVIPKSTLSSSIGCGRSFAFIVCVQGISTGGWPFKNVNYSDLYNTLPCVRTLGEILNTFCNMDLFCSK